MAQARSKYFLMEQSDVYNSDMKGYYPDIMTYPINDFVPSTKPLPYTLLKNDIYRFDILMFSNYSNYDFYDDFILNMNNIGYLSEEEHKNSIVVLPKKDEIDLFYLENITEQ